MKIAVIILHFGDLTTTRECLLKLAHRLTGHRLILVNNTLDDLSSLLKIIPDTILISNSTNLGFAQGVNRGINLALEDNTLTHIYLLNNDLGFTMGNFSQLELTFAKNVSAGIVSPILHHAKGYDWGGKYNKWTGMVKHKNWPNKPKTTLSVDHVAGAAMLIKREVIEKVGLLDKRFFLYFEDLDYCLRAQAAGFTIHINPDVVAEHTISTGSHVARRTLYQWRSHLQFVTKHLFRLTYPTAYLYDLFIYPLWLAGTVLERNSWLQAKKGSPAGERTVPNG
ncbi:MAG: glycosyltransferase family 2 protein, partial [bacterium]